MTVSVQFAAEHLEELLSALEDGQSIEVERPDKPNVRLSLEPLTESASPAIGKRILGAGVGELRVPSDEEWERMDREWRKSFETKFGNEAEC